MAMKLPLPAPSGPSSRPLPMVAPGSRCPRSGGFTLVEMLVALAVTLIMMGAVVTLFGVISESVADSRAGIEMSDRLRTARNQLQRDLQGATTTMRPPRRPADDEGYFEIIEGSLNDYRNGIEDGTFGNADDHLLIFGDADDVLMFTTRSRGAPFRGRYVTPAGVQTIIESPVAEVAYFLVQDGSIIDATIDPPARLFTLYRRLLLVAPRVGSIQLFNERFYDNNDISVHYSEPGGTPTLFPNTLGDLTKRENRFAHQGNTGLGYLSFPFPVELSNIPFETLSDWPPVDQNADGPIDEAQAAMPTWPTGRTPVENAFLAPLTRERLGDDVLLGNVLAFDVKVFDPQAPIFADNGIALEPHHPGWEQEARAGATPVGFGAYVDLGYGHSLTPPFSVPSQFDGQPTPRSGLRPPTTPPPPPPSTHYVYDTWSLHYEADGVDQDLANGPDAATNGLDDNGNGIVDDIDEYDTLPPYPLPLRGVKITIRVYEPSSKQVREAVVIQELQ